MNGNGSVCEGKSIKLTAAGAKDNTSYSWMAGSTPINATTKNYILEVAPTTETTYTVTGTNGSCEASATFEVAVNKIPTFDFETVSSCAGETNTIKLKDFASTTNTTFAWEWYNYNASNNYTTPLGTLANATSLTQTLSESRRYSVTALNNKRCGGNRQPSPCNQCHRR